jgi:hypothetical protein
MKGMIDFGLQHVSYHKIRLQSYNDSDLAGNDIDRKSTSRYFCSLGSAMILWIDKLEVTCNFFNNSSCIKLSKNPIFHDQSKHVEMKYHYIRDLVQKGVVKLLYIGTYEQIEYVVTNVDVLVAALHEVLTSSITFVLRVEYSGSKRTIKHMWNTLEEKSAQED